jgi:hypothetical protein
MYGMLLPSWSPLLAVQLVSAMSSGCAASALTNPIDLVRTRVQVSVASKNARNGCFIEQLR